MNRGVALLEQYQYLEAYKVFEALADQYRDWCAAWVNKGIAALNLQEEYFDVAEASFLQALRCNPESPHALLSLGILHNYRQRLDEALVAFRKVVQIDPDDPHALYYLGTCLSDKGKALEDKGRKLMEAGQATQGRKLVDEGSKALEEAKAALERVVKLQPSFASAHYRLFHTFYRGSDEAARGRDAIQLFSRLQREKVGVLVGNKYGESGRYNCAIRDSAPPGWEGTRPEWSPPDAPALGESRRISAGKATLRRRPDGGLLPPAFAIGDLTGDGRCELVLCGEEAPGEEGAPRTAVYTPDDEGSYTLGQQFSMDGVVCAIGDLDSDGDADLVVGGEGWLRFLYNEGEGRLEEKKVDVARARHDGMPVRLYCADLDSDWDLDVACLRQVRLDSGEIRSHLELIHNNRDGTFQDIAEEAGAQSFGFAAVELVVTDLDGDVDADLVVIDGGTGEAYIFENERLWRYRLKERGPDAPLAPGAVASTGGDWDGDGDLDLVILCGDALHFWRNEGRLRFVEDAPFQKKWGQVGGGAGVLADFLGSMESSLLVLDPTGGKSAGGEGRSAVFLESPRVDTLQEVELQGRAAVPASASAVFTILGTEGPPELVVYDTDGGARAWPVRPAGNWMALNLEGSSVPIPDQERANLSAIGTRAEIRVGTHRAVLMADTGTGGAARAPARIVTGLRKGAVADYVRLLWADAVLQSERNLSGGRIHDIKEIERKPTSCPMLLVWDGEDFEFVGDFLGVGGLGYLELPGVYSSPDPTEYLLIDTLRPLEGEYALEIIEPMEECTYLDEFKLTVVEHPADVSVIPDEMFAIQGPAPDFELLGFRGKILPVRATTAGGTDVTPDILEIDRKYSSRFRRDRRFPGLSEEMHVLELEFDDRIDGLVRQEGTDASSRREPRPFLALYGFVEYGYSTSNFAAWQARASFHAPTVEVERSGRWVPVREEWGFPGGYPRTMTVDLSGCLERGDRRLRVTTNMAIHWDHAFLLDALEGDLLEVQDLSVDRASLSFKGFPREESPDGSIPKLYRYEDFDPIAPIKVFPGNYTRYGRVEELLSETDDRFVIFGPGDCLSLRIRADRLPPLPAGKQRTFLAKTRGYCKDTDLYTAHPDRVEPLPFRGMGGYPYNVGPETLRYLDNPELKRYRATWNTRRIEGSFLDPVESPGVASDER